MTLPIPTYYIIALCFLTLFLLERVFQLRPATRPLKQRLLTNGVFTVLVLTTSFFTVRPSIENALEWSSPFGLLSQFNLGETTEFILGFLLLDLSFYYWHRLNHVIPLFWRFHNVHHSDPDMDTSTAFRFHFGEVAYSSAFRFVQVLLIGMSLRTFAYYELFFIVATIFHHSNLKLPIALDRFLNYFIVTPRMHEVHHSQKKEEVFSNYSVIFSFWDRLHKSFSNSREFREISIGVPAYNQEEDNSIEQLVAMPFVKQRKYWGEKKL